MKALKKSASELRVPSSFLRLGGGVRPLLKATFASRQSWLYELAKTALDISFSKTRVTEVNLYNDARTFVLTLHPLSVKVVSHH